MLVLSSFFLLSVCYVFAQNDTEISYYENLIKFETTKALTYSTTGDASWYRGNNTNRTHFYGTFDYIVIGSGAAGSVVANQLSEDNSTDVLVLEAGGFENDFTDIPSMASYVWASGYNWGHQSIPQNNSCLGYTEKRCPYPRGRGFGGTTIINGLVYARGNKADYDKWGRECEGWSYKDVLPVFKQMENSKIDGDEGYHAVGGSQNIEYSPYSPVHLQAFLDANVELGRKIVDYNGINQIGASRAQFNMIDGQRMSAGKAFIDPVKNRLNLHLSSFSFVTKILISRKTKAAYGVLFMKNGKQYKASVRKEIILCAGSISSPHILMLSGVGPRQHLQDKGINVIKELPIGDNLQDHPTLFGLNFVTNTSVQVGPMSQYIKQYLQGTGPYTLPVNNAGVSFWTMNSTTPEIEIMMIPPNRTSLFDPDGYAISKAPYQEFTEKLINSKTFTFYIILLHPKSIGTIRLSSSDPFEYPLIDSNFLQDDKDIEALHYGVQQSLRLIETEAFQRLDTKLARLVLPPCEIHEYLSTEYWYCTIRQLTTNIYHPIGTCRMGTVVDNRLRVKGISKLRVADGSILPFSFAGHTSTPCSLVGQQLANFIKKGE